jgi:histone-lysine N-methyltransferase SETD3
VTDALGRLSSWLIAGGGHHDGVEIRERDGMRGVVATRRIAAGSELAQIPRSALISVDAALASLAERQMRAAAVDEMSELTQLALWLLVERRDPRSAFRPYLDTLPPSFPDFPINAAPAELALLDGTLTGSMVDYQRATLESDHARLEIDVPWFREFSFDDFVWAKLCVGSRTFALVIGGQEAKVLVPFADMLNHAPGVHTRRSYDDGGRALRLLAQREYQAGEEVFTPYGSRSNKDLLLQYGFCMDHNDADQAVLGTTEQFRVSRDPSEPIAQHMLAKLRAVCGDEAATRAALADAARAALAEFSTTIVQDESLLAGTALPAQARNFVLARLGEKRVLQVWLDLATAGPSELFR